MTIAMIGSGPSVIPVGGVLQAGIVLSSTALRKWISAVTCDRAGISIVAQNRRFSPSTATSRINASEAALEDALDIVTVPRSGPRTRSTIGATGESHL